MKHADCCIYVSVGLKRFDESVRCHQDSSQLGQKCNCKLRVPGPFEFSQTLAHHWLGRALKVAT